MKKQKKKKKKKKKKIKKNYKIKDKKKRKQMEFLLWRKNKIWMNTIILLKSIMKYANKKSLIQQILLVKVNKQYRCCALNKQLRNSE